MNTLAEQIIKNSFSKQEALSRLAELRLATEEKVFGTGSLNSQQEEMVKEVNKDNLTRVFETAEGEIRETEALVVYTARELPEIMAGRLGKKARELFGETVFLDWKVDPALLGGTALAWRGQYRDYSLRKKLEEKKEELRTILNLKLEI